MNLDQLLTRVAARELLTGRAAAQPEMRDLSFDIWWQGTGQSLDPDTSDVDWHTKRKALSEQAFRDGWQSGRLDLAHTEAGMAAIPDTSDGRTRAAKALIPYWEDAALLDRTPTEDLVEAVIAALKGPEN